MHPPAGSAQPNPDRVMPLRVLIVRPSALGDVCRSVPLLASLRAAYPDAQIDWLVQDSFRDAVEFHPALNRVVPFERRRLGRSAGRGNLLPSLAFLRTLRRSGYDLVIDAQGLFRSGLFARATGARIRVGYHNAEARAAVIYNCYAEAPREHHAADRMLALLGPLKVEPIDDLRLYTPPREAERLEADAEVKGLSTYAVIAPTSRWASKRWPPDRFAVLCERLLSHIAGIVLVGGPGEQAQIQPLLELAAREPRVLDRVGKTSVGGLMALIERAQLVVANDSAALHMAVGFDRPAVALFGPTRVELVGPRGRERDVTQHVEPGDTFDHKDDRSAVIMDRIPIDEVLAACIERLP